MGERVISYVSRLLSSAELNYSISEKGVVGTRSSGIPDIKQVQTNNQNNKEREGRAEASKRAELTLLSMQKLREFIPKRELTTRTPTSIAETFANIRKRCVLFTHVTVPIVETFGNMRKRRADSRTSRFACAGGLRQIESAGFHKWALPVAVYGHPLLRCRVLSLSLLWLLFPCSKSAASKS